MNQKNKIVSIVIFISILFLSCRKESEKPSWDSQILAPLVKASLGINNLLPDSVIQANADSSLKIVYQNEIYKLSMDTLFSIPDTTIKNTYNLPVSVSMNSGQTVLNNNINEITYNLKDVELRSITMKSGFIKYIVKNKIHEVIDFKYNIPCATLNGVPFSINVSVPAAVGNTPGIYSEAFDLSGYIFNLTGINNNKINTIYTSLTASIGTQGNSVTVNPEDSLIIENTFSDLLPYYAKGYFGQNTINAGPAYSDFTFFNRIVDGTIQFEDVNFNLKLENPIGLDARVNINNLTSLNTRTSNSIDLSNSVIGSPININRATENNGISYPTYANFPLNTSNSNIKQVIENLPDKFGYSIQIQTNPLGNISGSNDFIYTDRLLKASMDMEIPLSIIATDLTLADTLDINLTDNPEIHHVHSGVFTLYANNGFPFNATIQMYLLNEQNQVTDSLLTPINNTIEEAPLNPNFRATNKKISKLVIPLSERKMDLFFNTKKIALRVKYNTSSQPNYVKIYSNYTIDLKLVGDFNYTIQLR